MPLTNSGRNYLAGAIIANPSTLFDNSNAYLGVGDGTTAFNAAQTDLQGTNKYRQGMEATYPQISTNVVTFRSLFATGNANFAWEEWGTFNASTSGTMLNRKVESLGTKTSSASWQLTVDLTVVAS